MPHNQIADWKEENQQREALASYASSAAQASMDKKLKSVSSQDALVYAFFILLSAVHESYHTATTKAKALNAAQSRMSALIRQQDALKLKAITQQANYYYTMQVRTKGGTVYNYFTYAPPTSGTFHTPNGASYKCDLIKNDAWVRASEVQLHSYQGKSFWSYDTGGGVNTLPTGHVFTHDPGVPCDHHSGYKPVSLSIIRKVQAEDAQIGKARDFLTGKLNVLKMAMQPEEMELDATADAEGMIIQQGEKWVGLLGSLSSEINQL